MYEKKAGNVVLLITSVGSTGLGTQMQPAGFSVNFLRLHLSMAHDLVQQERKAIATDSEEIKEPVH